MGGKVQQYFCTEYIQPPSDSPTLDAKNSPLALLAQTCSAIGKERVNCTKSNSPSKNFSFTGAVKAQSKVLGKTSCCPSATATSSSQTISQSFSDVTKSPPSRVLKREKSPAQCSSPTKKQRRSPDACKVRHHEKRCCEDPQFTENKLSSLRQDVNRRHRSSHDSSGQKIGKTFSKYKLSSSCSPQSRRSSSRSCDFSPKSLSVDGSQNVTDNVSPHAQMTPFHAAYCAGYRGPHVAGNPCFDKLKSFHLPFYAFNNFACTYPFHAQMLLAATARNASCTFDPTPHVCNWVNAETGNCGKRFSNPDELFHHLRTHAMTKTDTDLHNRNSRFMIELEKMTNHPYAAYLSQQASILAAARSTLSNPENRNLSKSHSSLQRFYKHPGMLSQRTGLPSFPISTGVEAHRSQYAYAAHCAARKPSATPLVYSYH